MSAIHEYNLTQSGLYYDDAKGKRRMSADFARQLARKEAQQDYKAGGFGCQCEKCGKKYGQSYLVYVYLGSFKEGYVCKDCQKQYHLQRA